MTKYRLKTGVEITEVALWEMFNLQYANPSYTPTHNERAFNNWKQAEIEQGNIAIVE